MEVFTLEEWEENFDDLLERVENGEHIGIVREDGTAAVMMLQMMNFYEYTLTIITSSVVHLRECCLLVKPLLITEEPSSILGILFAPLNPRMHRTHNSPRVRSSKETFK